ncbi:MAG: YHS domain-containing (seleno)protein [Paracoccus sp. (in: a-proteobacteria)]|uniref:YHS domain-containing (seleno)protein n=1 Tax=Paracoccus sp. TaxID=267 RepID=UPI0026E01D9E|nr:YHS domain-containing (seleno)protein [Paracoccus sp. (in: a-proteobacteria)]MDO5620631.1 YHS domain-containing (seleno)protein [Paracoccus sp. (in: a-proteobacteria)]
MPLLRLALLSALLVLPLTAQADPWALNGMDPVAAREGRPQPGRRDITTEWKGQIWHFSSEAHRMAFEANPRAYIPGLGGYCVVALAEGRPEPGDPQHAVVIGQRIYLTQSARAARRLLEHPRVTLMQARRNFLLLSN